MTTLILEAPGAVIHAADVARRTITGRVLTYGEFGNTSAGRKRFRPGSLELPTDTPARVLLLRGHTDPVTGGVRDNGEGEQAGAAVRLLDDPVKLDAEFRVTTLPVGDTLLAEANPECPIRAGLSVEVDSVEYDPADPETVIRARLKAVAAVPFQAYPSSRMTTVAASAHPTGEPFVTAPAVDAPPAAPAAPVAVVNHAAPEIDYDRLAAALAPALQASAAAVIPAGLPTGGLAGVAPSAAPAVTDDDVVRKAASLQAAIYRGEGTPELHAALQDITNSNLSIFQAPTGTLGEKLWEGASYQRRFVGLMRQKQLTSWKFTGWRWINRPRLQDYAGNKTDVPSNSVSVDQVEGSASRLAGAWDIDRKFVDFGDADFWTELYAATAESYLEESDARAASALISYAIDVTADPDTWPTLSDDVTPAYTLPAGFSTGAGGLVAAQASLLKAAALGTAILKGTPRVRQAPDYVLINTFDWLALGDITSIDVPAFLGLLGVNPGGFDQHPEVPKGHVILGCRNGATFRELGSTPIRVQAQNIPKGGVDEGAFGYTGISMDKPGAIISVPITES